MEPKSIPKRYDIEVDFQERTKVVPSPSWRHLEAILGHFGPQKRPFCIGIHTISSKSPFLIKINVQDAFWTELGSIRRQDAPKREAKWNPRGSKYDTKKTSKC